MAPDAPENLTSTIEDGALVLVLHAPSARSARATLEDLLPCLAAAEKVGGSA